MSNISNTKVHIHVHNETDITGAHYYSQFTGSTAALVSVFEPSQGPSMNLVGSIG